MFLEDSFQEIQLLKMELREEQFYPLGPIILPNQDENLGLYSDFSNLSREI